MKTTIIIISVALVCLFNGFLFGSTITENYYLESENRKLKEKKDATRKNK